MNYELSSLVVAETTTQSPRSPTRQSPRSPLSRQSPRSPLSPKSSKALKSSLRGGKKGSVNFDRGPRFSSFANSCSSIDSPTVAFGSSVNPDSPRRREFLMSGSVTFANSARIGSGDWGEEATESVRFTEGGRQVDPLTQAELKRRRRSSLWAGGSSSANPMIIEQPLNDQANNSTKHDPTELKRRRMSSNAGRRISTAATAVEQDDLPLPQASTNKEEEFSAFPVPTTLQAECDGREATEELDSGAAQDAERAKRVKAKANILVHSFSDSSESGNVNFPHLADFRNCTSQAQHQAQLQESKLLEEKVNKMLQDEIRYRPFDISREIDDAIEIKGRVLQERARLLQARKK